MNKSKRKGVTVNIEGEARAPPRVTVEKTYDDNKGRSIRSPLDNVQIEEVYPKLLDNYDEMAIAGTMSALDKVKENIK